MNMKEYYHMFKVPLEVFGLMQQIYNRALYSLGPDVGCYAPPMLYENEMKESLQVSKVMLARTNITILC